MYNLSPRHRLHVTQAAYGLAPAGAPAPPLRPQPPSESRPRDSSIPPAPRRAWLGNTESSSEGIAAASEVPRSARGAAEYGSQFPPGRAGGIPGVAAPEDLMLPAEENPYYNVWEPDRNHLYYHHYTHVLQSNQKRATAKPTTPGGSPRLPPIAGAATAARSYSQMRDRPSRPIRYRTIDHYGAGGGGSIDRHVSPGRSR